MSELRQHLRVDQCRLLQYGDLVLLEGEVVPLLIDLGPVDLGGLGDGLGGFQLGVYEGFKVMLKSGGFHVTYESGGGVYEE